MDRLVSMVAQGLHDIEEQDKLRRKKRSAERMARRAAREWENKQPDEYSRFDEIKELFRAAHKKLMAKEDLLRIKQKPARHSRDPFHRIIVQLYDFFSANTSRPYRYAGAITSCFGMHPKLCHGCDHLRAERKYDHRRKHSGLATKIREGIGLCKIDNIFECPRHKTVRETLTRVMEGYIR